MCDKESYCKTCGSNSLCSECHFGFVLSTGVCVPGTTAYCQEYKNGICQCCQYPTYWDNTNCVRFPASGYATTPTATTNKGIWPSAHCGCYRSAFITAAPVITKGANDIELGKSTDVFALLCKNSRKIKTNILEDHEFKLQPPNCDYWHLDDFDDNFNDPTKNNCSACRQGFLLDMDGNKCTQVGLNANEKGEKMVGCGKCSDLLCKYCAKCQDGFSDICSSNSEADEQDGGCCKTFGSVSNLKMYNFKIAAGDSSFVGM